jgi:hypothetical protein
MTFSVALGSVVVALASRAFIRIARGQMNLSLALGSVVVAPASRAFIRIARDRMNLSLAFGFRVRAQPRHGGTHDNRHRFHPKLDLMGGL